MPDAPRDAAGRLTAFIRREALAAGFDAVAVTSPDSIPQAAGRLGEFLAAGRHGTMAWMAETAERRGTPGALWPEVRSVVMLAMNYGPEHDPLAVLSQGDRAAISVYAQNRDYHDIIKGRLKTIAGKLTARAGSDVKVFVDTAPVMEKPLAEAAGLGWQGKHTNLVSRAFGSWLFLGSIFTTAELEHDAPERDHCGSCRACLDICPTDAFPAPYQLDARRCISYLTIELKGSIPEEFRPMIGNRIYGCDDCLAACPWNRFAGEGRMMAEHHRLDLGQADLLELLALDGDGFRAKFRGTPMKRTKRRGVLRNVCVALGNVGDAAAIPALERACGDPEPLIAEHAEWALGQVQRRLGL